MGEDAFRLSLDFQQEVERMVTTGRFDVSSLLEHLTLSDFAENYMREKNEDHMAMAAWVKYGESAPEQVADELDKAVVAQDKRTYREMLSSPVITLVRWVFTFSRMVWISGNRCSMVEQNASL